jgi:hypothetical protein
VNFAINQAWGRFGVSAIFNNVNATYYTGTTSTTGACPANATGTSACNHPDDKWGWAVLSGIDMKTPWLGSADHIGGFFNYGIGASAYSGGSNLASPGLFGAGNTVALGVLTDGVFVDGGQFQLTTTWTAGFGYEHFWLPNFSTTVFGTYTQARYNDTVINSRLFCGGDGAVNQNLILAGNGRCDPGFNFWTIGSHTDWYPVPNFRLAVEVLYARVESAFDGQTISLSKAQGLRPSGLYTAKDQGILSIHFRAQRAFASGE